MKFNELTKHIHDTVESHYKSTETIETREELEILMEHVDTLVFRALENESEHVQKNIDNFLSKEIWTIEMNPTTKLPKGYIKSLLYFIYKTNHYIQLDVMFRNDYSIPIIQFYTEFGALENLYDYRPEIKTNILKYFKEECSYDLDQIQEAERYMNNIIPANSSIIMEKEYPNLSEDFLDDLLAVVYIEVKKEVFGE